MILHLLAGQGEVIQNLALPPSNRVSLESYMSPLSFCFRGYKSLILSRILVLITVDIY